MINFCSNCGEPIQSFPPTSSLCAECKTLALFAELFGADENPEPYNYPTSKES